MATQNFELYNIPLGTSVSIGTNAGTPLLQITAAAEPSTSNPNPTGNEVSIAASCLEVDGGTINPIVLKTDGVSNSDQTALNLIAGSNITLTAGASGAVTIAASGGGGSLDLETDGTPNGDQTLLNLAAGTGISLSDNSIGTVTITNNAVIELKTDNVANGSQVLLNLVPGYATSITDDGFGGVTIASNGTFNSNINADGGLSIGGGSSLDASSASFVSVSELRGGSEIVGQATLSGGTVTVNTTKVAANSKIFVSVAGTTPRAVSAGNIVAATSFDIFGTGTDVVNWLIVNLA